MIIKIQRMIIIKLMVNISLGSMRGRQSRGKKGEKMGGWWWIKGGNIGSRRLDLIMGWTKIKWMMVKCNWIRKIRKLTKIMVRESYKNKINGMKTQTTPDYNSQFNADFILTQCSYNYNISINIKYDSKIIAIYI